MRRLNARTTGWLALLCASAALLAAPAQAQREVGTVVAARGTVELQRGSASAWTPAPVGQSILIGDIVRTGEGGSAKILFADDAVADLGSNTHVEVARYTIDAAATEPRSLLRVSRGKLAVHLSEFYATARLRYETETPTAVVRAAAGSDVVVTVAKTDSDVFVRAGSAQVQGILGVIGPPIDLAAGQLTRVQQGSFPAPPREATNEEVGGLMAGLEIVGTGAADGLDVDHPVTAARLLRLEDRPEAVASRPAVGATFYLGPEVPGETLQERLSPDLRTNTQPIEEFRAAPPGEAPTGTVHVHP